MVADLWTGRKLAWRLFLRDTAALYRQSVLGYIWAFLPPVATTGVFVFLSSQKLLTVAETPIPYPAYVMIGAILWQSFVDALHSPIKMMTANKAMLVKINFPREALLMAGMLDVLLNFMVRATLLIPVFWIFAIPVTTSILLFPIAFAALLTLGVCIGLALTPIGLIYTDIGRGISIATGFWLFLTPVVYPPATAGLAAYLTTLNPVSPLIITARNWLISQPAAELSGFLLVTIFAVGFLLLGWMLYRVALPHVIERMGS